MRRRGFTLVELLVVIAIIGILSSLVVPTAYYAMRRAKVGVIAAELHGLDMALKAFKMKYGDYPPDFADADRGCAVKQVRKFINKTWPRMGWTNASGVWCTGMPADFRGTELPDKYHAGNALLFWLGGLQDADKNFIGLSANPSNPFDVDDNGDPAATKSASRVAPFYEFDILRIAKNANYEPGYWPASANIDANEYISGYVYFRSFNKSYGPQSHVEGGVTIVDSGGKVFIEAGRAAVTDARRSATAWMNRDSFQIRACGLDGKWWGDTDKDKWGTVYAGTQNDPPFHPENYDDQLSGTTGTFEDALPD